MTRLFWQSPDKGLIFNIQRFSIHDGPGIRTTVFMKGCPLRCLWCSNPESQDFHPNLMVRNINCQGCGKCVDFCPNGAITLDPERGRLIDWTNCSQCLKCVEACIYQSLNISGRYMALKEVFDEVRRDIPFYKNSGGGITVSGGEALCQSKFVAQLLKACKEEGMHTVLDTTGCVTWETMEEVLPFVDLILFDVKNLDSNEHRRTTGADNHLIMENLARASKLVKVWLRVPLIADFNDSEEQMKGIACLARDTAAEKVSLLPYHEGGKSKCEQLGRPYLIPEAKAPNDEHVEKLKEMIMGMGIKVTIGS